MLRTSDPAVPPCAARKSEPIPISPALPGAPSVLDKMLSRLSARAEYRNILAHSFYCERRLWGSGFDVRRVLVFTARAYRANNS